MDVEDIQLDVDTSILMDELEIVRNRLEPCMDSPQFGGWSLLSSNGSYRDGWVATDVFAKESLKEGFNLKALANDLGLKDLELYHRPTEACLPATLTLLGKLEELGLYPRRARYILLKPGGKTELHRDWPEDRYGVRLHIPLLTNDKCSFIYQSDHHHLQVGKVYLIAVNRLHRTFNDGTTDRIHIVCDAYDTKGISRFHQMSKQQMEYLKCWPANRLKP